MRHVLLVISAAALLFCAGVRAERGEWLMFGIDLIIGISAMVQLV